MYPTGRGSFSLIGGKGVMAVSGRGRVQQSTLNTKARDVTMQFDVTLDKLTGGPGVTVVASCASQRQAPTTPACASVERVEFGCRRSASVPTTLSTAWGPLSWCRIRYQEGKELSVRAQVIKRDPTQVRLMVWPAGGTPPTRWQLVRNDHGGDIGAQRARGRTCPDHPRSLQADGRAPYSMTSE